MAGDAPTPPSPPTGGDRYEPGTVVVLRELLDGRVRSARPLQVVEDAEAGLVAYLVPRSEVAWPRLLDGAQSQTPDQGWVLRREEWQGPGCLFVLPPGEAYAAVLFFDRDVRRPLSWKVDFLRPPERNGNCLDTLDWALDLLVPLDRAEPAVKDLDDLAQLRLLQQLGPDGDRLVHAARARAEAAIAAAAAPFDDRWVRWRPAAGDAPLRLPEDCLRVDPAPEGGAHHPAAPTTLRSGTGTRVLDAAGRSWLDLDLAGGRLVHGHAHPVVVAAVTRQLALGLGPDARHASARALERMVRRRLRATSLGWAGSGDAALGAAVAAARRVTGRDVIALWARRPHGGGGADEAPQRRPDGRLLVLDEDDPGGAADLLERHRDDLAAVVVDPLALAASVGAAGASGAQLGLIDGLRRLAAASSVVVVADERRTVAAGPGGGCARLGLAAEVSIVGEAWFGGLAGGAVVGRDDIVTAELASAGALHPAVAAAGLATLDLLDDASLDRLDAQAQRLRAGLDVPGLGPAFRLPAGSEPALRRAGIWTRSRWGFLATVSDDDDVDHVLDALVGHGRTGAGRPGRRAGRAEQTARNGELRS